MRLSWNAVISNAQPQDKPQQSSDESDYGNSEAARKDAPAAKRAAARKTGPEGSLALFRAADIAEPSSGTDEEIARGVDNDGLILTAMLAGGDYDLEGLMNCGVKVSWAVQALLSMAD